MARRSETTDTTDTSGTSDSNEPEVINRYSGTGVTMLLLGLFILAVLVIILLAQNTQGVPFEFLWFEAEPPLFVLILVTAAAAAALTEVLGGIWRRRRRTQRTEREELQRLRRQRQGS